MTREDKELVEWLRNCGIYEGSTFLNQAADRIVQLGTALQIITRETTAVSPDVLNQQMCIDAVNRHAISALQETSHETV